VSDPVATQARLVAGAFRSKGLRDVADMLDYLADRADAAWDIDMTLLTKDATPK
jgi:hypothetical protein